ncbi:hypothetical protein D3OALGA1CA_2875 [Olavius algarvensis associated proteobacterium Delta 3]|nr:hypothetical protein D3OALGA1CA_2875 [Olavius algarvensis associated proteobacterium Delta 3]CAB5162956.1 hypothetical protein D3OALGB2SA_5548 [Olavius algarvensis associated proteobacterium Delta 3]
MRSINKRYGLSGKKSGRLFKVPACVLMAVIGLAHLSACVESQVQSSHLRLMPASLAKRQLQTRVFDTDDEEMVLAAGAATLQDIGFLVDESEVQLGLIVASKERSAIQPAQVTAAVLVSILTALAGSAQYPVYDETQIMRVSLVVSPVEGERSGTAVRVTFQRIVYDSKGGISKSEPLGTPEIYQEFFAKLSKALFLEANEI